MSRRDSATIDGRRRRLLLYTVVCLILSYAPFVFSPGTDAFPVLMLFWSFFCTWAITLRDETVSLLEGESLIATIAAARRHHLLFAATGAACGFLLDGLAQWLGRLWIYPYWTSAVYVITFIPGSAHTG